MEKYKGLENIVENIKYNEPMKMHTTMKVGGPCDCLVEPTSIEEIKAVLEYAKENNIEYYVIGNGSNLLVKDEGIRALVIKLASKFSKLEVDGEYITACAGCSVPRLSQEAKNKSLSGLEFACGIPGSVGGAIRMNAGAYGSEMVNVVEKVGYLNEKGELVEITGEQAEFSYRHSMFVEHPEYVVVYAKYKLTLGNIDEISSKMEENMTSRKTKQPLEYPNFGSVFKRPEGYFVGKLVEDSGLKGYSIGGAQVSTKHSGFMINTGDATCKDVLDLIEYIKKVVYENFNVMLHEEVVVLGGK
ncbi:MAG: UDP-N-acetylmuramate dehydrogenase [Clostridia bacterium]|nr:UDP-N-acetylmuramate dehydrogenase [Clostridia bacterium]